MGCHAPGIFHLPYSSTHFRKTSRLPQDTQTRDTEDTFDNFHCTRRDTKGYYWTTKGLFHWNPRHHCCWLPLVRPPSMSTPRVVALEESALAWWTLPSINNSPPASDRRRQRLPDQWVVDWAPIEQQKVNGWKAEWGWPWWRMACWPCTTTKRETLLKSRTGVGTRRLILNLLQQQRTRVVYDQGVLLVGIGRRGRWNNGRAGDGWSVIRTIITSVLPSHNTTTHKVHRRVFWSRKVYRKCYKNYKLF